MARQPNCYAVSEDEWMAILSKRQGNSLSVTVPRAIILALALRPGMRVKLTIEKMPRRKEPVEEEDP